MNRKSLLTLLVLPLVAIQGAHALDKFSRSQHELRVGIPGDYAPMAYKDQHGNLIGFDIDMADALGKWLHRDARFIATSWPELSRDLAINKFDIAMGGITYSSERNKKFALSHPVIQNGKIALAHCAQAEKYPSLEKLDRPDTRLIVNPGGTNQTFVKEHIKQAQVIYAENNLATLRGLRYRLADVMITDVIEGKYYQHNEPGILCIATKEILPGTTSFKVYMTSKENQPLLDQINQWLAMDHRALFQKWNIQIGQGQ